MVVSKKQKEYVYWTDRVAEELKQRVKENKTLQKIVKERGYIVYDEKTPSGRIHIGSGRGWVIHDIIAKTLRDHKLKGRFILSSDDMDPFDAMPSFLPKEKFDKYMGIPFRNVPSPEKGYESYADYFFSQCTELFEKWGIEAELESTGERYIRGDFNWAIKIALDNSHKIQDIYQKIYGKTTSSDKLPFNPICEKCGRIGTTVAYEWDKKRELLRYFCKPDLVDWAKGCGHDGEISPYNGNGKLPWKVEWAAKWPTVGVVAETAGKDHFTRGGSRTVAIQIACNIFNYPPPWPSTSEEDGKGYEFFLVEGKKMSTSKGIGTSFAEISTLVPPEILRFLMVKTRPETIIDFKEENIPMIYSEFEKYEKIYFGLDKVEPREERNAKRIYELSYIGKIPSKKPFRISFDFASMLSQSLPKEDITEKVIETLKKTGHLKKPLNKFEKDILTGTLEYAELWSKEFAPERLRLNIVKLSNEIVNKLSEDQKNALRQLGDFWKKENDENKTWEKIKKIALENNIPTQKLFEASYIVLLDKTSGPRLMPLMQSLDKDFVVNRLKLLK